MFDKVRLAANIRILAQRNGVKIGELEEKAGLSAGYISRLSKTEEKSSPSLMELVCSVSERFGVSVDLLLKEKLQRLGENELYLLNFLAKLKDRTEKGTLSWNYRTCEKMLSSEENFNVAKGYIDGLGFTRDYRSEFDLQNMLLAGASSAVVCGKEFYIVSVRKAADGDFQNGEEGYELYFADRKTGKGEPIVCAKKDSELYSRIHELFLMTMKSVHQICFSESSRTVIEEFMRGESEADESSDEDLPF